MPNLRGWYQACTTGSMQSVRGSRFILFLLGTCGVLFSPGRSAHAACLAPTVSLLWSTPQNGARDVPTNSVFWAVDSGWMGAERASLNGVPLAVERPTVSSSRMVPAALELDTDYVLRLEYLQMAGSDASGDLKVFQIAFHTSTEQALAPTDGAVSSVAATIAEAYDGTQALCRDVLMAQACLDVQNISRWTFQATNSQAIAWLVQAVGVATSPSEVSAVWPTSCGAPELDTGAWLRDGVCFDLRPIGRGGLLGGATQICYPTIDAGVPSENPGAYDAAAEALGTSPKQAPAPGSCEIARQQGKTSAGLPWLFIAAALVLARRRPR